MLRGRLQNIMTNEIINVHATTDSPDSSYGFECWVDNNGQSYGQVQFGEPLGFVLLMAWDDDSEVKP